VTGDAATRGDVARTAGGRTTVLGSAGSGACAAAAALVGAAGRSSAGAARKRVAAIAPSAPIAAAATIQAARGRSRTTITVGSFGRSVMLTGATDPALLSAAAIDEAMSDAYDEGAAAGITGLDRRTNAGGGEESKMPGASGSRRSGTVVVRRKGGAVTAGSRETDDGGAAAKCDGNGNGAGARALEESDAPDASGGGSIETGAMGALPALRALPDWATLIVRRMCDDEYGSRSRDVSAAIDARH
jgi:hypothetical protein